MPLILSLRFGSPSVPFYSGLFKSPLMDLPGFEPVTLGSQVHLLTRVATVADRILPCKAQSVSTLLLRICLRLSLSSSHYILCAYNRLYLMYGIDVTLRSLYKKQFGVFPLLIFGLRLLPLPFNRLFLRSAFCLQNIVLLFMTLTALLQSLSMAFPMTVKLFICLASWPLPVPGGGHFGADRQSLSVDLISVSSGSCFLARRLMLLTLVY